MQRCFSTKTSQKALYQMHPVCSCRKHKSMQILHKHLTPFNPLCSTLSSSDPLISQTVYHGCFFFHHVLPAPPFSAVLKGIQCRIRGEVEGCAHMLLGNDSFSVPTQPADSQQDTIAEMQATRRPHIQSLCCLAQKLGPWHPG